MWIPDLHSSGFIWPSLWFQCSFCEDTMRFFPSHSFSVMVFKHFSDSFWTQSHSFCFTRGQAHPSALSHALLWIQCINSVDLYVVLYQRAVAFWHYFGVTQTLESKSRTQTGAQQNTDTNISTLWNRKECQKRLKMFNQTLFSTTEARMDSIHALNTFYFID